MSSTRARSPATAAAACLAALTLLAPGYPRAQATVPAPEQAAQEGLRRQEQRNREQQKSAQPQADQLRHEAAPLPARELPQESPCFTIHELALGGRDAGRFGWLLDAALPYLRRCVGAQGLSFIAAGMDQQLRDLGYATTRVALPAQNLRAGQLLVHIEAGRVADIRAVRADAAPGTPDTPDTQWGTWRNAFPVAAGDILNVRDLEQGVENMKRLPSQAVATRLEPGDAPGSSVLYIERKGGALKDRLRGGATLDNSGGASLGRTQLSANLAFDNPLGLNDVVTASLNTNAERPTATHRSQGASISYSLPWGYNLLTLHASNNRFAQYVQGTTVRFLSSGRSQGAEARLQRTVLRTASTKVGVYGAVSTRRAISYLDDVEVVIQRRRTTSVEAGLSYKHLFEKSSLELDLGVRRGMPWHGAQDDFASAREGGLTLRPKVWSLSGAYATDVTLAGRALQYSVHLRGQHTRDTTLSADQMAIGGRSSVRGFDGDAVLLAENGIALRNELTAPVKLWDGMDTAALLAIDYGRVWGPSDILLTGKKLAGLALGLKGRRGATQFEVTLATPLAKPDGFATRDLSLYLSLTQGF
ncbi:MAG: ShlB/FhaC/HecB family hemolysin secretion/activation protein [Proteobacteria bacterium]|nr:ShlB/FhaC/HecB family hemolysin secretion/activation protein [Pseudomonadota bacterium]